MARPKKVTPPKAVDETVTNQENPGTSETERPSTEVEQPAEVSDKVAPAMEVDETVVNQESPGTSAVNRLPDPQLVTDSAGITYDVNKTPQPELVTEDREAEKNRIRQTESALDARNSREDDDDFLTLEFVESGLTYSQRVWKKGEVVEVPKDRAKPWMDLSAKEQEERWGQVKFEKR